MPPELANLIHTYGYWLMIFGALIEGETFLIAGGVASHQGYFNFWLLILFALVGSTFHDCFFFGLGRYGGHYITRKKPSLYTKVASILKSLEKYGVWLIIGLRYAYGLRTMIPAALGMSHIGMKKFFIFDVIGGILWSFTFIGGGYLFGMALVAVLDHITQYGLMVAGIVFAVIVVVIGAIWAGWVIKKAHARIKKK